MSLAVLVRALCVTFIAMTTALVGCAGGFQLWKPVVENAAVERTERERDMIEDFSQRRDDAQYQAALQSWASGDPRSCRELIEKVLERNPKHKEARQLMADLYLDEGSQEAAKEILDQLLIEFPNDAPIHHSLGLLYEAMNNSDASLRHLGRAVELEPENELYRICYDTTLVTQDHVSSE
jgi:tetratricopeptide (TPR) repeat protein